MTFLDSSAFAKLLIDETASDEVRRLARVTSVVMGAALLRVELRSFLARREREGLLPPPVILAARRQGVHLLTTMLLVGLNERVLEAAAALCERRGLRSLDAIQLAAALDVSAQVAAEGDTLTFACFDRQLRAAAVAESLTVFPA